MINENIITAIIAASVSIIAGVSTYIGTKRRDKIDAAEASNDFDLKMAEREDRLRSKLWGDIEEKLTEQDGIIQALRKNDEKQARQIEKQAAQIKKQAVQIKEQAVQIKEQAVQIKELIDENAALRAENNQLKNGNGHKRATL